MSEQYVSSYTGSQIDAGLSQYEAPQDVGGILNTNYFDKSYINIAKYGKVITLNCSQHNIRNIPSQQNLDVGNLPSAYIPETTYIFTSIFNSDRRIVVIIIGKGNPTYTPGLIRLFNYGEAIGEGWHNGGWMVTYVQ